MLQKCIFLESVLVPGELAVDGSGPEAAISEPDVAEYEPDLRNHGESDNQ